MTPQGETPLVRAALANDVVASGELVRAGADVNLQTPSGRSPLIVAAEAGNLDLVKLLVENGAKIDEMNKVKATPLFAAANSGRSNVVEYLLSKNADPSFNRQDSSLLLIICLSLSVARSFLSETLLPMYLIRNPSPKPSFQCI